jgi:cell division transport system permease protein
MLTILSRSLRTALVDAKRNLRLSFFTVLFLLVALLFVDLFFVGRIMTQTVIDAIEDRLDVTLYFKEDAKEDEIIALREELQKESGVTSVLYLSPEEVLQRFKDRHKSDETLLSSLALLDGNPLGARLVVDVSSPIYFATVKQRVLASLYAALLQNTDFTDNEALIARVTGFTRKAQQATTALAIFFVIVALIAVYSTMSIIALGRADDIHVMQMVGATASVIRFPFLFLQMLYTVIALLLNAIIVGGVFFFLRQTLDVFFIGLPVQPTALFFSYAALYALWKTVGALVLVGVIALIAVRRYVRAS